MIALTTEQAEEYESGGDEQSENDEYGYAESVHALHRIFDLSRRVVRVVDYAEQTVHKRLLLVPAVLPVHILHWRHYAFLQSHMSLAIIHVAQITA